MSITKTKSSPQALLNGDTFQETAFQEDNPFADNSTEAITGDYGDSQEEFEELKQKAKENNEKIEVTQIWEESKTNKSVNKPFVMAFTDNLMAFSDLNITKNQLRVVCYILEKMEYGNLININQKSIAETLGIAKSNMSNIFKQLKGKEILVEDNDKNLYVNSNLFAKGLKHRMDQEKRANLQKAQKNNGLFKQSWT